MIRALHSSAAGMQSQQMSLDVIANNLANVQTTAFKKSKIEFQDVLYQHVRQPGSAQGQGAFLPTGIEIGNGSQAVATAKNFSTGELVQTGDPYNIAIQGDGFFQVILPDNSFAYTRDGAFKLNRDGQIVTSDGLLITLGGVEVPEGTVNIEVSTSGTVSALIGGQEQVAELGQIPLFRFRNPAGLQSIGRNLYTQNQASGEFVQGVPGELGFGTLNQGAIEKSNVKVIEEMVNMIVAQRAFEVNSKAIKSADEMMSQTNNLKR